MKITLIAFAAATLGVAVASPSFAAGPGKFAGCYVEKDGRVIAKRECKFHANGPGGSFQISGEYKEDLARGVAYVDVKVGRLGAGVVYARLANGRYVRWGSVSRSTSDRGCWVGSGLTICAL